jgi:putative ABC transport system permease protein
MSVLWVKFRSDLFRSRGRTLLAVFSIASGLFAVGAIFGMVDQLLSGMDRAHRLVDPSHVNIILRQPVPSEVVEGLQDLPGVAGVDPANQVAVRYKVGQSGDWKIGLVVQRPNWQRQVFDRLELKGGAWPSGGEIGVERLAGQYFSIEQGSQVIFEIDETERAYTIGGLVRHPFVQPPLFGGQAHFFMDAAELEDAFGIPPGSYNQVFLRVAPYSLENAREAAADVRARLAEQGYGVVVSLYQDPDRHWGRMFVEGINLVLQVMAVVSLFMSVVLVLNTFTALITQETDQIGVMKAVGARRWTIVRLYLAGALAYGLAALVISLPAAMAFSFMMTRWFLNLFNIDLLAFQYSQRALALQTAAALVTPLLAALPAVLKGASISVREAVASYGLGGDFGASRLDRLVERLGAVLLPTLYAAALGNLFRRKLRLALTVMVLVTAGVMFLVVMSLIASTNRTLDNEMARQGYDVRLGLARPIPAAEAVAWARGVRGVREVEAWLSLNATMLRQGERLEDSAGLGAQLIGLPAETSMYRPIVVAGRWLEPADDRAVVLSQETAEKNSINVGDFILLDLGDRGEAEWLVVGTYRVIYGSGFVVEPIYAPFAAVNAAASSSGAASSTGAASSSGAANITGAASSTGADAGTDLASQILVKGRVSSLEEETALADRLKERLESAGLRLDFYTTAARLDQRVYADNQFASIIATLLSLAMLVAVVGGLGLAGALGISVVERTREIGVLRAVGARSPSIMAMMVMEGVLQGLLSFLIAVPLAFGLAQPMARQLGRTMLEVDLDFAFHYPAVAFWLALVVLIAVLASIVPARRAARLRVVESLAYT